jgi:hypothetical protein
VHTQTILPKTPDLILRSSLQRLVFTSVDTNPSDNATPWTDKCPPKYWNDVNNHKKFVDWAAKQLNIKEMSDWYKVSKEVQMCFFARITVSGYMQIRRQLSVAHKL